MNIINDFCEKLEKKYGKQIKKNEKEGRDATYGVPASFIVFDDIMSLINQKSGEFKNFISIFRHYNITLFISTQYITQVAPLVRQQTKCIHLSS
jgi:hypothetical protein